MTNKLSKSPVVDSQLAASIDNPSDLKRALISYMPTWQSIEFVNQIADLAMQRCGGAHSLQGAYGIGKSSLGIFALHQLAAKNKIFTPKRSVELGRSMHSSVKRIQKMGGMLAVPVIGSASPLAQRICAGLKNVAKHYSGRRPKALIELAETEPHLITNEWLLLSIEKLLEDSKLSSAGVLLMVDEFGRQFEHMLATGNLSDLQLLQSLAELPGKGRVPFSIIIIQHHGLEHYISRFLSQQHAEWEKVRGRFNEYFLSNSETDTARIISKHLSPDIYLANGANISKRRIINRKKLIEPLEKEFVDAANKCYPLHPMTIFILARLSRLLGQGDRTVVGWLSTHLDTGYIAAFVNAKGVLYPDSLFRHFFGDIQNIPANPAIARRFNAVHSAYSRHGADDQSIESRLLKTIGLLYFCQGSGLKADIDTIKYSMPERSNLKEAFKNLGSKSLVTYRRHRSEYRVWEGSDYDIQSKLYDLVQSSEFSPASSLEFFVSKRVLAHKHLIETGNHRTAGITWTDKEKGIVFPTRNHEPGIFVWLDKEPKFSHKKMRNCVWGVLQTQDFSSQLQEAAALQQMLDNDLELQQDIVASGEVRDQLAFMKLRVENKVNSAINSKMKWHLGTGTYDSLQVATSIMMDSIYSKSLMLHNEIINREQTSGQATLATRLIIEAMVHRNSLELFGIEKFPPSRLIYESVFRNTGIHKKSARRGWFLTVEPKELKLELTAVVKQISRMAEACSSHDPCGVAKIIAELGKPPYGIKQMPALLLCCIFIYVKQDHVELYEDGNLLPTWSDQTLARLVKAPNSFSLNVAESFKFPKKLLSEYRRALGFTKTNGKNTPLNLAKEILIKHGSFSIYSHQTSSLSVEALAVRRVIHTARSPSDMLFVDFPKVFGHKSFPSKVAMQKQFFNSVRSAIKEIRQADEVLIESFKEILLKECSGQKPASAKKEIEAKAEVLKSDSQMHYLNDNFLRSILECTHSDFLTWFRNVLEKGLDIPAPLNAWTDEAVANAEFNFRNRLIWLRQAAEVLTAIGNEKGGLADGKLKLNGKNKNTSKKLSELKKLIGSLSLEYTVPLLINQLIQHRGKI